MTTPFPYPGENILGIVSFMQYVNVLCKGFLGVGILIIIGFVSFLSTKNYTTDRALSFSTFLTLISAILLRFLELINDSILLIVVVIFILSVIYLIRERNVEAFRV